MFMGAVLIPVRRQKGKWLDLASLVPPLLRRKPQSPEGFLAGRVGS